MYTTLHKSRPFSNWIQRTGTQFGVKSKSTEYNDDQLICTKKQIFEFNEMINKVQEPKSLRIRQHNEWGFSLSISKREEKNKKSDSWEVVGLEGKKQ